MTGLFFVNYPTKRLNRWFIKIPVLPIISWAFLPVVIHAFIFGTVLYRYFSHCGLPVFVYRLIKNCRYLPVISTGINTGMPLCKKHLHLNLSSAVSQKQLNHCCAVSCHEELSDWRDRIELMPISIHLWIWGGPDIPPVHINARTFRRP